MSFLTICQELAKSVGLESPDLVITSPKREWAEAVVMSNAVGDEIARRVDFGVLRKSTTLVGDGVTQAYTLPNDFSRIIPGIGVQSAGATVRPLTNAEWASLAPVVGVPRYFLLEARNITLWPFMAGAASATVRYQSRNWCGNGSNKWASDSDVALVDEELMVKGLIVHWRRQKGMPYEDYEAEYEAALTAIARFDDRSRI